MSYESKWKDRRPTDTINAVQEFLRGKDIHVEETNTTCMGSCYAVTLVVENTNLFVNGKGSSLEFARASAYGELMERVLTKVLFRYNYYDRYSKERDTIFFEDEVLFDEAEYKNHLSELGLRNCDYHSALDVQKYFTAFSSKLVMEPFNTINGEKTKYFPVSVLDVLFGTNGMAFGNTLEEAKTQALSEQICDNCGSTMVKVGEEFVRTEVQFIPAKLKVIDHYRETYECRSCRKNGTPYMEKAPVPYPPVLHSLASASTITWLIHQKFELSIPLYRQEKEWEALGLRLSRATMSNWLLVVYRDWLVHIVHRLKLELLKQRYLHIDETHVQVLKEPGRSGKYPEAFLREYEGYIHTDAYSGYNAVSGVKRCLCYTHLRRAFVDALPPDQKKKERLIREKPLLEAFWSWAEKSAIGELPKSKLSKAFHYALNNREGFWNYLEDGNCSISNSLAENCIRPFVIGRKNWLFSGSPKGAEASAGIYTLFYLTLTAKA